MSIVFIPQPKKMKTGKGYFALPVKGTIGISGNGLFPVAKQAGRMLGQYSINIGVPKQSDAVSISLSDKLRPGGYSLSIGKGGVLLKARDVESAYNGLRTLEMIAKQSGKERLPFIKIEDWPDMADRGVYYDLARGRVPKLERLMQMVDLLAEYKINQLQLYIEHTFKFRRHPGIGKGASPLTAEDIMELDRYCCERGVELVPSLSSFGHLSTVLRHPRYRHLAEDWGIGRYLSSDADKIPAWARRYKGWSLAPANPAVYKFLEELFDEFLPCFSSKRFNVCCDETMDLGMGQSYKLAQRIGKGRLYLGHIIRLRDMAAKYGKKIQFWGDIIRSHPELIPEIPRDVTVLDWGYDADMNFERIKDFTKLGLDSYVCPTVCGYTSLFPRVHQSCENIAGWAAAGVKYGAKGMLNTDWGDGGHYNFMECAWYGYLFGAEQAWNVKADRKSFTQRFCRLFMGISDPEFCRALDELGDITHLHFGKFYQSIWQHIYFARPGDDPLRIGCEEAVMSSGGRIMKKKVSLDAKLGRDVIRRLEKIRKIFVSRAKKRGADPSKVLDYWIFSIDTIRHAARKLAVLGAGGRDTTAGRKMLKAEMKKLMTRFERLWMARNRRSEIGMTLKAYRRVIRAL